METIRSTAKLITAQLVILALLAYMPEAACAQTGTAVPSADSAVNRNISQSVERVEMLVKSSRILTLEERIPKFQVHNETILGATPVSENQIQIFAKTPGTTQLNLWDINEKLYTVDVTVMPDAREVEGILGTQLPLASLKVLPINGSCIVSGTVTSVDDVDRAVAIVEQFYATVVNNIKVVGVQQILLHTKIMEVSRTKLRDLGIDWGAFTSDSFVYSTPSGFIDPANSSLNAIAALSDASEATGRYLVGGGDSSFAALVKALRRQDLVKLLAEPTVVATHGRPARFNVGGRVPVLVPGNDGAIQIQYEEFGTAIDFLPFVVGPGRVRLEVRPEVSEVDPSIGVSSQGLQVNGFRTRYVETAVEMQAGQTFAIAGLLQTRTESFTRSTIILGELPVIGSLFRRVRERRNDIELLVTVTPEFVAAMDPYEAPTGGPGLHSTSPTDKDFYINGHIEVPNLLGSDNCVVDGSCGQPGCEPSHYSGATSPMPGGNYGAEFYGGNMMMSDSLPNGAVIPNSDPIVVGDGVTLSSPAP